ncbi:transposase [[Actinomadura] parvosata]|uniref:transposase n=1 Tax=[Actinomadura] parvosata TaxID=1955412 RepID=UPI00406CA69F
MLSRFRNDVYACLKARVDALFELADALLCEPGPVRSPVDLTLSPEYRRGHGALYGGLNHGRIDVGQLRKVPAGLPLPRWPDGRIVLAVDVSPWLRSDAACSAERLFCHVYGRAKSASQFIPGWPYSFAAVVAGDGTSPAGAGTRTSTWRTACAGTQPPERPSGNRRPRSRGHASRPTSGDCCQGRCHRERRPGSARSRRRARPGRHRGSAEAWAGSRRDHGGSGAGGRAAVLGPTDDVAVALPEASAASAALVDEEGV